MVAPIQISTVTPQDKVKGNSRSRIHFQSLWVRLKWNIVLRKSLIGTSFFLVTCIPPNLLFLFISLLWPSKEKENRKFS